MNPKNALSGCFSLLGISVLILDSECALSAAASGIDLCLKTVIPSLFPFLFLTGLLTDSLWGTAAPLLHPLNVRLGLPEGSDSLLLASLLGGYPAGAAAVSDSFRDGRLSKETACHLLSFCSNAGPAFLFGMTAGFFPNRQDVFALWAILILTSFLTGMLTAKLSEKIVFFPSKQLNIPQILNRSVKTMALICGWILLFRILVQFLTRWILWRFPEPVQVLITGLLELSNGCVALGKIARDDLRFLICGCMLSFGGLCVTLQTASVTGDLPLKPYVQGKTIQTVFTAALSLLYLRFGWVSLGVMTLIFWIFPGKRKKVVDFTGCTVYNNPITTGRNDYAVSQKN